MENRDTWILAFLLGVLCFNWPLLDIFRDHLPVYLFAAWSVFILIIALLAGKSYKNKKHKPGPPETGP